jgi:hypothetical protein
MQEPPLPPAALVVAYFEDAQGTIKLPYFLIWFWKKTFSYLKHAQDHFRLRWLCRLFRDALPPPPIWTIIPSPIPTIPVIEHVLNGMNAAFQRNPSRAPMLVILEEGQYVIGGPNANEETRENQGQYDTVNHPNSTILMDYPITIIGEGNGTRIDGGIFSRKDVKAVVVRQCIHEFEERQETCEEWFLSFMIDYSWLKEEVAEWDKESEDGDHDENEMHPISKVQLEMENYWCECATEWYEDTGLMFDYYDPGDTTAHQDVGVLFDLIQSRLDCW